MKSAIITGGTGGLGTAVVPRLLRDYRCAVIYRQRQELERLAEYQQLVGSESVDAAARELTPVHALVLLAGAFAPGAAPEDFAKMFEANVATVARAIHEAVPHLADGGRIVAISSEASVTTPAGIAAYAASKAAVNALIQSTARELASRRITVNAILPSALATPAMLASGGSQPLVPIENVAETIAFLLGDSAANITGQLIVMR